MVRARAGCIFWSYFFEFLVFCHAFRANSVVVFHVPANQTNSPTNRHAPATRTISGDSDGDDGASSGFLLALRRIRIRSGGVLLSSHRAPSHLPLHGNSWRDSTRCCRCCVCRFLRQAENQITTSKQTAFCDRILKTHRTTPSKVALFASG